MHKFSRPTRSATENRPINDAVKALIALSGLLLTAYSSSPALAEDTASPDISSSVTIGEHANKAAKYWESSDFVHARDEFRRVISYAPTSIEGYEGLMNCCEKTKEWPQVAFACEKIFDLDAKRKQLYEYDYGLALYNMNQFDKAIPHLRASLATADISTPKFKPIKVAIPTQQTNTIPLQENIKEHDVGLPPVQVFGSAVPTDATKPVITSGSSVDLKKLQNFENAIRSEFICIAEYRGYDKNAEIRFNSPASTHWHIEKIIKGPPLNSALPLRYFFHTPDVKDPPVGWKFDESKLPQKGSKWIIFIEFAVAERGFYNTYMDAYGRQPATEENLNLLDRLLTEHNMQNSGL